MFAEALADRQIVHPEVQASTLSWLAYIYGRSGETAKARHALDELLHLQQSHPMDPMLIAAAYGGFKDKDQALVWLEKGYEQHSPELASLRVSPRFDFVRGDPRFENLLRRVGLMGKQGI